jgi:hypothetical protein
MDVFQRWLLYAAILGILVIALWVGQWINRRKSEHRRVVIKTGPKVDRFLDPAKAIRPGNIRTQEDSRTQAIQWWDRCGLREGICGVCNCTVKSPEGYLVPFATVAESRPYLDIAVKPLMEFGTPYDQAAAQIKEYILSGTSPWLVCGKCKDLFFRR